MVQEKDTLNKKQSLPCLCWCHGLLFFLHQFLRLVLLFLLHHSGKLAIPHGHLFLLIQILHIVLFKCCSAKAIWVSLEISLLSSSGLEMEIATYHSWGELIYHLLGTDLLRSIFNLFSTICFEKLSSSWCKNTARIAFFTVGGQHLSIYPAVPLTS